MLFCVCVCVCMCVHVCMCVCVCACVCVCMCGVCVVAERKLLQEMLQKAKLWMLS